MADNQVQQIEELKDRVDTMFSFASQVHYRENHLLPVIQASKSLIGLNLDDPPQILLKWLEQYIHYFQPNHQFPQSPIDERVPEVLSVYHLEVLIAKEKREQSRKYLAHLIQTADLSYLMELFLEISLNRSVVSSLFCWAAFKSIQFMEYKDSIGILFLSLDCLYNSQESKNDEKDVSSQFHLLCNSIHMKKAKMIRSEKINPLLLKKIEKLKFGKRHMQIIPKELLVMIQEKGEKGLLNYLLNLKIEEISADSILILGSVLSVLRYSSDAENIFAFTKGKTEDIC